MIEEDIGCCPWCGETGVDFAESDPPADYCGHDPALIRSRQRDPEPEATQCSSEPGPHDDKAQWKQERNRHRRHYK